MKITEALHGRYRIRAGIMGGRVIARAFLAKAPRGGVVIECEAKSEDEAIAEVKAALDARAGERQAARRADPDGAFAIPTTEEYAEALIALHPEGAHRAMLIAHANAGDEGLTVGELARAAGYSDFTSANLQYGILGRKFAEYLDIDLPGGTARSDADVAASVLAVVGPTLDKGKSVWVMHPELREAVAADTGL